MMVLLSQVSADPAPYVQYGIAGALIIVVGMFLASLKFLIEKFIESHKETIDAVKTVSSDCHLFQENITKKNSEIMEKVSTALNANTTALAINTRAIEQSKDAVGR